MNGRVSAGRQFVVATVAAYSGYPPEPRSNSRTNSGLRKIRRKVSLDFAKFDWTRHLRLSHWCGEWFRLLFVAIPRSRSGTTGIADSYR
jgi:hypothetical protein